MISKHQGITLSDIEDILFRYKEASFDELYRIEIRKSYDFLHSFARQNVVYGINTGFGPMAQYRIDDDSLIQLQYNLIRSHSTGAGAPLAPIYVKAAMLARLGSLVQGYSGINLKTVDLLVAFINQGIIPFVPEHGSVGASGDLVQLSHIALCLIGEGEVFYKGERRSSLDVMKEVGLSPLEFTIREGLSLANGTSVMTGIGLVNLIYGKKLLEWSVALSCMVNEIAASYGDFMSAELNGVKWHEGQNEIAQQMRSHLKDSRQIQSREEALYGGNNTERKFTHKVQPYYSLRCVPQILGAVADCINNSEKVLIAEVNSVCDNPIVDYKNKTVYHGGNFHGDYISFEMDKLKMAVTKLTMLAERQLNYLFHDKINEILPPFLNMGVLGLNYGMQACQFTATSTTAECQMLSNPMYVHSIPNNNDNQDIVSMGTNSAMIAKQVIENSFQVLAIEMIAVVQAVDCLDIYSRLAGQSQELYTQIRELVPLFVEDTPKYKEIEKVVHFLKRIQS